MKHLFSLFATLILLVTAFSFAPGNLDPATLRGGAAFHDETGEGEPQPKKYDCIDECANASNCATSDCQQTSPGVCSEVIREFSGKCVENDAGPLNSCVPQAANDYCYKDMRSRCTPENITCTRQHSGCGTKMRCI